MKAAFIKSDFVGNTYTDVHDCALCRLFKRLHPEAGYVSAGSDTVGGEVNGERVDYETNLTDADKIEHEFVKPESERDGFEIELQKA